MPWFKVHDTFFSDHRLRFCMEIERDTGLILLWCLARCCSERSNKFKWSGTEPECRGLAGTLCIATADENQIEGCLTLLADAGFIIRSKDSIEVVDWQRNQSDYLARKNYFAARKNKSTVQHGYSPCSTDNNGAAHTERRGEERRREENISGAIQGKELQGERDCAFPASEKEACEHAAFAGVPNNFAISTWNKAMSRGRRDAKGNEIMSFRHYLKIEWTYEQERRINNPKPKTLADKQMDELEAMVNRPIRYE